MRTTLTTQTTRLESIGKRYRVGGPWVLKDIDLALEPGRIVRIAGNNGSGKSTLLRVIAGIAAPTRGRVTGGASTGYVPERFPPALPFTAGQFLRHQARIRGVPEQQGMDWLERLGAEAFAKTAMRELSKGTSQKIAIAQALLGAPGLLVLDEAWTGLDSEARAVLEDVVEERVAGGGCVVFVDHDPARLADATDERWLVRGAGVEAVSAAMIATLAEAASKGDGRRVIEAAEIPEALDLAPLLPKGAVVWDLNGGRRRVVVDDAQSDDVLRALLGLGGGVHIASVRAAHGDEGAF